MKRRPTRCDFTGAECRRRHAVGMPCTDPRHRSPARSARKIVEVVTTRYPDGEARMRVHTFSGRKRLVVEGLPGALRMRELAREAKRQGAPFVGPIRATVVRDPSRGGRVGRGLGLIAGSDEHRLRKMRALGVRWRPGHLPEADHLSLEAQGKAWRLFEGMSQRFTDRMMKESTVKRTRRDPAPSRGGGRRPKPTLVGTEHDTPRNYREFKRLVWELGFGQEVHGPKSGFSSHQPLGWLLLRDAPERLVRVYGHTRRLGGSTSFHELLQATGGRIIDRLDGSAAAAKLAQLTGRSDPRRRRDRKRADPARRTPARSAHRPEGRELHFAGYNFTSGPWGSVIHRGPPIDTKRSGDHGADPLGNGKFRMVPSGDIVDYEERNRRLDRGRR